MTAGLMKGGFLRPLGDLGLDEGVELIRRHAEIGEALLHLGLAECALHLGVDERHDRALRAGRRHDAELGRRLEAGQARLHHMVGMSGAAGESFALVTAMARSASAWMLPISSRGVFALDRS